MTDVKPLETVFVAKNLSWFSRYLALIFILILSTSMAFYFYVHAEKQIDKANQLRLQSFLLADELRQSFDDLTQMVLSYVTTGDAVYKDYFHEILAIRDGTKPRPLDYQHNYWALVQKNAIRPSPDSQAIPLLTLMKQTGFSTAEFSLLEQIRINSDALTQTELAAMALVEGKQPVSDSVRLKATTMLFDEHYRQAKANIMQSIGQLATKVEQRTNAAVQHAEKTALALRSLFIMLSLLLLATVHLLYKALQSLLGCSISKLHQYLEQLGLGDFSKTIAVKPKQENSILAWVSKTQQNLRQLESNRQQTEQQLRDSEIFTNSILNSLAAHIAVLDGNGTIIAVNEAWRQFGDENGLPKSRNYLLKQSYFEQCQKSFQESQLENAVSVQYAIMAILAGTHKSFELEYPCHSPTEQRWFYMRVTALSGKNQGVVVSHENITQRKKMEEALRNSEAQFRAIIQISPIPLALNDNRQNVTFLNNAFVQTFGYDLTDIPTLSHWWSKAYPDPVYRQRVSDIWQASLKQAESEHQLFSPLELDIYCKNGTIKTVLMNASAIVDSFEYVHLVMMYDITERKQAEAEQRIAAIVFEAQEGMVVTDANKCIMRVNKAFTEITGYTADEVIGKNPSMLSSGRQKIEFYTALWQRMNDTGAWEGEIWNRRKSGEIYPQYLTITIVKDPNDNITNYVATFNDITLRKAAEEEIKQLAFFDPLTGLPNRRKLQDRLQYSIALNHRANTQFAVFMMDLDKFKAVNDNLGHAAGDELLKQVAARITNCLRDSDMVARLGGDEFVLVLENLNVIEDAETIALKVIADLTLPFQLSDNDSVQIGASIGISIYPQHGNTPEILMDNADTALYQAKDNGRGCFTYFSERE